MFSKNVFKKMQKISFGRHTYACGNNIMWLTGSSHLHLLRQLSPKLFQHFPWLAHCSGAILPGLVPRDSLVRDSRELLLLLLPRVALRPIYIYRA